MGGQFDLERRHERDVGPGVVAERQRHGGILAVAGPLGRQPAVVPPAAVPEGVPESGQGTADRERLQVPRPCRRNSLSAARQPFHDKEETLDDIGFRHMYTHIFRNPGHEADKPYHCIESCFTLVELVKNRQDRSPDRIGRLSAV